MQHVAWIHRAIVGNAHSGPARAAAVTGAKCSLCSIGEDAVNIRSCPRCLNDLGKMNEVSLIGSKIAKHTTWPAQQAEAHGNTEPFTKLKIRGNVVDILGMNGRQDMRLDADTLDALDHRSELVKKLFAANMGRTL